MAALVDLATHNDLDDISIGELANAAGVNRATFYLHYTDKEALLLDAIDAVTDEIAVGASTAPSEEFSDADHAPLHTLAFFEELDRRAALYRRILGPTGSPAVVAHLREGMQRAITKEMVDRSVNQLVDDRSIERSAAFVAGGVIAAATEWLSDDHRIPASEEAAAVWRTVLASMMPFRSRILGGERAPDPDTTGPQGSHDA